MTRIICDTQIWYHLTKGIIKPPEENPLIGTILSIEELTITKNQEYDIDFVRDVIRTAMTLSNGFLEMPPFHHIISKQNYLITRRDYSVINGFLNYTKLLANNQLTKEIQEDTLPYRKERKAWHTKTADEINTLVSIAKQTQMKKKDYWEMETFLDNREVVKNLVETATGFDISSDFDWSQFELFEKTMEYWFKELALNKTLWVKPNDVIDFFNLVYVEPRDLYWCRDKTWNLRIQRAGLSKYLYEKML